MVNGMIAGIDATPTKRHKNDRRTNARLPLHLVGRIVMMQRPRGYPHLADLMFKNKMRYLAAKQFRHSFSSHELDYNHRHASWAHRSTYWVELRQWVSAVEDVGLSSVMAHMRRRADGACTKRCVIHSNRLACLYEHCEYDYTCMCHDCEGERAEHYREMQNDDARDHFYEMYIAPI